MPESTPSVAPTDKREHPRFEIEGTTSSLGKPGILTSLGFGPIRHSVINLSQGGLMVRVGRRFDVASRHELRIEIPKLNEVIETLGEVRWCAQSARNDSDYYVGIRFVDLPDAERGKLAGMTERYTTKIRKIGPSIHLK